MAKINNGLIVAWQEVTHNNDIAAGAIVTGTFTPLISLKHWTKCVSNSSNSKTISKILIGANKTYELYNAHGSVVTKPVHIRFIYVGY